METGSDDVELDQDAADLEVAHHLATIAASVALPFFKGRNRTWSKSDGTPVSDADLAVDAALRTELARLRPADGVLTEESQEIIGEGRRRWILDPVDGTYQFVAGQPHWGTNVALEVDGVVVLGVVTRPVAGQRWWAARGEGAFRAGEVDGELGPSTRLRVSVTSALQDCRVSGWPEDDASGLVSRLSSAGVWVAADMTILPQLLGGDLDAVLAMRAGPWDFAPAVVLVEEAGGSFCDLLGGSSIYRGSGLFTNGSVRPDVRRLLDIPPR